MLILLINFPLLNFNGYSGRSASKKTDPPVKNVAIPKPWVEWITLCFFTLLLVWERNLKSFQGLAKIDFLYHILLKQQNQYWQIAYPKF